MPNKPEKKNCPKCDVEMLINEKKPVQEMDRREITVGQFYKRIEYVCPKCSKRIRTGKIPVPREIIEEKIK